MIRRVFVAIALTALTGAGQAGPHRAPRVGDTYELDIDRESSTTTGDAGTGSSTDRDAMIERIVGISDAGIELEYDLPPGTTANEREIEWQYPVRVLKPAKGPMTLTNVADMEKRRDRWLNLAKLPKSACGHYYFTWNLFQVECDPQAAVPALEALDLQPSDLSEGGSYRDPKALAAAPFRRVATTKGVSYTIEMVVDPDRLRNEMAKSDVAIGEIMRKPISYEAALETARAAQISGTISARFDMDPDDNVFRRTTVTKVEIKKPGKAAERRTTTETVDRHLIMSGKSWVLN